MHIASFSFIGLGTQPPAADWGVMLSDSKQFIRHSAADDDMAGSVDYVGGV